MKTTINNNQPKFGFHKQLQLQKEAQKMEMYKVFEGFTMETRFVTPTVIDLNQVMDKVKLFSMNYSVAGAVGIVTDGIYKFNAATTIEELAKTVKDFGKDAIEGQRYATESKLIRHTKVISRLGGQQITIRIGGKYEVQEFFKRLRRLDINALNKEDMDAMKADMQVIGRIIQEIAIDVAKNKDLSAGIDPMNTFGSILVLSKLRNKFQTSVKDNRTEIFTMVRESITKNQAVNIESEIDSVPDYKLDINDFKGEEFILDWAGELQDKLAATQERFFNVEMMPGIKTAGTTKEDLAIRELTMSNYDTAKEMKTMLDIFNAYSKSLVINNGNDAEENSRNKVARMAADKKVKAAFRDTTYAIARAKGLSESDARKLAYGATMLRSASVNVANANLSCIDIIGEEDTLLMWSNEEGIVRDAIKVDLSDYAIDNIDFTKDVNFGVEFINDVAYDIDGNEVAYGCFTDLNCKGVITIENNKVTFIPERDTNLAPIGDSRIAMINKVVINGENKSIYTELRKVKELFELAETPEDLLDAKEQEAILETAIDNTIKALMNYKDNLFFVSKTKASIENAICTKVLNTTTNKMEPVTLAQISTVGDGYATDMFNRGLTRELPTGQVVALTNKAHTLNNIIKTDKGLVLVLSC